MRKGLTVDASPIRIVVTMLLACAASPSLAHTCSPAEIGQFGGAPSSSAMAINRPQVELTSPGAYCLGENIHQAKLWDPWRRRELVSRGGEALILISADDVSLDLWGHVLSNDRDLGYSLLRLYEHIPGARRPNWFARTKVRNGFLISPGSKGTGLSMIARDSYRPGFGTPVPVPPGLHLTDIYRDTSHLIETLNIRAGKRAILIDGRNNVIRNNRITVDAITAIVAQGPGIIIENNVIEVRNDLGMLTEHDRRLEAQAPFVIRLIQADGAIIRNNEIRMLDRAGRDRLPAAIELVETAGAVVQGNVFGGVETAVRADASSSFQEEGNSMEPCPGVMDDTCRRMNQARLRRCGNPPAASPRSGGRAPPRRLGEMRRLQQDGIGFNFEHHEACGNPLDVVLVRLELVEHVGVVEGFGTERLERIHLQVKAVAGSIASGGAEVDPVCPLRGQGIRQSQVSIPIDASAHGCPPLLSV